MNSKKQRLFKALASLTALSVLHLYVFGSTTIPVLTNTTTMPKTLPGRFLAGRLTTLGDYDIIVNGNKATTGTTIFSGAQLQTPADVTATIEVESLGVLNIAPNTDLVMQFDAAMMDVQVRTGDAFLHTVEGVKGSVTSEQKGPDDETQGSGKSDDRKSDKEKGQSDRGRGGSEDHGQDKGEGVLGNLTNNRARTVGLIIFAGLVTTGIIVATHKSNRRPAPLSPSGP